LKTILINLIACAIAVVNELTQTAPSEAGIALVTILNIVIRGLRK